MDYGSLVKGKFEDQSIRDGFQRYIRVLELNDRMLQGRSLSVEEAAEMLELAMFSHLNSGFLNTFGPVFRVLVSEALHERSSKGEPALPHFMKRAIPAVESMLNDKWPSVYQGSRNDMARSN